MDLAFVIGSALHASSMTLVFFFFNDPATTEIYTLPLHGALPIYEALTTADPTRDARPFIIPTGVDRLHLIPADRNLTRAEIDRKSTRLNSSHSQISYAVFCLKKKNHEHRPAGDSRCCRLAPLHGV